jgi:hypothetical protein
MGREIEMDKIKFDCYGNNAPAYGCSKPGDNSGWYYKSTDVDDIFAEASKTIAELCQTFGVPLPEETLKRLAP